MSVVDADGPDTAPECRRVEGPAVAGDLDVQDGRVRQPSAQALPVATAVAVDEHTQVGGCVEPSPWLVVGEHLDRRVGQPAADVVPAVPAVSALPHVRGEIALAVAGER